MRTKIICTCITILFFTCSCDLDEKIYGTAMADSFITTSEDVDYLINGIYLQLQTVNKKGLSCNLYTGADYSAQQKSSTRDFSIRTLSPGSWYLSLIWDYSYKAIVNVNSLIGTLQSNNNIPETYKNRIIGELYFLRAYCYFDLVRLFGGVPLRLEPTTGSSDYYLTRSSVDEVYTAIFKDFIDAGKLCIPFSQQPSEEFGRATRGAAHSMLALAYLTYGNYCDLNSKSSEAPQYYQFAKNYADSVILSNEYSLIQNYADLWDVKNETKAGAYKEVIFAIQFARDATASGTNSKGSQLAYYTQPTTRYYICGNVSNGAGVSNMRIQPWFYDICTTGDFTNDYRSEVSFLTRWSYKGTAQEAITYPEIKKSNEVIDGSNMYCDKYRDPKGLDVRNHENDFYAMRLSEVYLIKAEAENELNGPTAIAYAALNKLRERARLADGNPRTTPPDLSPGLTKEEFRMKVFDERGLEFLFEGKRVFDNVRMRYSDNKRTMVQYRYETFYPGMSAVEKTQPVYDVNTNSWGPGKVYPPCIVAYSEKLLLWPIPSTEDANPNITQNPGW